LSGLNLAAIEDALWDLQFAFNSINRDLDSRREPLDDEVVVRMIEGYAFINQLLTDRIDLFALGNSAYWLNINAVALCGRAGASAESNRSMLQATESRFYDDALGGFREIMDWYARAGPACLDSSPRILSGSLPGFAERGAFRFCRGGGRA
jgi:hypothetical protein